MERKDVRWKQRLANFTKSVRNLDDALAIEKPNTIERQGLIKAFELSYELAWKTLQDYLREVGIEDVIGPRPVIRSAFENGLLTDGDGWRAMHQARNESAHLYDEDHACTLEGQIRERFRDLLQNLSDHLTMKDE
ncbi:MAG: HI0074 family nucleotidyltransferase substrate-binding subunit [Spirochaeta sp.]|jgi:nucleotidyltransferase substrate binding protein (TIGR01987 family)|nr:HI0074 family nucleotidyltransferase substrate-binding subunit [Spirochaeta sp.]